MRGSRTCACVHMHMHSPQWHVAVIRIGQHTERTCVCRHAQACAHRHWALLWRAPCAHTRSVRLHYSCACERGWAGCHWCCARPARLWRILDHVCSSSVVVRYHRKSRMARVHHTTPHTTRHTTPYHTTRHATHHAHTQHATPRYTTTPQATPHITAHHRPHTAHHATLRAQTHAQA